MKITIELVNVNGQLVGRRFQDRWNLDQLGYTSLKADRNQSEVKKFRRFYGEDFVITTVRGGVAESITDACRSLLSRVKRFAA